MARDERLSLLKVDLGLLNLNVEQETYLYTLLDAADAMISRRGVVLHDYLAADDALVAQIAGWMYRARGTTARAVLPDYLRREINDRLVSQKMREGCG